MKLRKSAFWSGVKEVLAQGLFLKRPTMQQCGTVFSRSLVIMVRVVAFTAFFVLCALGYLSFRPISLTPYLKQIEPHMQVQGYALQLDELALMFDGSLQLYGRGVSVSSPQGEPILSALSLKVELSSHQLLIGRALPKHILVDGASLSASMASNTLSFAGLEIPFALEDEKPDEASSFGIIEWLNNEEAHPRLFATLKTIELKNALLRVSLPDKDESWRFIDTNIRFSKYFLHGEQFHFSTTIQMGDYQLPAMLAIEHPTNADVADVRLRFERSDAEIIRNHLPEILKDRIQGQARVLLSATLGKKNQLSQPRLELSFGAGRLDAHELYGKPLLFKHLKVRGAYDEVADVLELDDFTYVDMDENRITLKGKASDIKTDNPYLDVIGSGSFGVVEQFLDYFPDAVIPETRSWLKIAMNGKVATLSNLRFFMKGRVKDFPFDDTNPETGYKVSLDFQGLDLTFMEDMPPARRMDGHVDLFGSRVKATADTAILSLQNVTQVSVTIDGLFEKSDPDLYINLAAEGEVEDVLGMVFRHVERGDFKAVSGRHNSVGHLQLPLKDHLTFQDAIFELESDLLGIQSVLPYIDMPYESPQAFLQVSDKTLSFQGTGMVNGRQVMLAWQEDMHHFGDKTEVQADGILADGDTSTWLAPLGVTVKGEIPFELKLKRLPEEGRFEFQTNSALAETSMESTLNWQKAVGEPANLSARGRIDETGQELWFDMVSFRSEGAEILGSAVLPKDIQKATIQLNPFKVGRTDIFFDYDNGDLNLMGEALDVSVFQQAGDISAGAFNLPSGKLMVNLRNLYLPKLTLEKVEGTLTRDKDGWQEGQIGLLLSEGKQAQIAFTPQATGRPHLRLYAEDAGDMLLALGLYDNLKGGVMSLDMDVTRQYGLMSVEGEGPLLIEKGHIINAPIIARIISLLWPGQLFNAQKGIAFDKIAMHLTLMEKALLIKKAVMNGPSLGLRFQGKINTADETLDAKGSIIPVEGLNKMFGAIPLVGKLLTGSQDALVAADFSVKGAMADPEVFVNPLSVVTPGLVKDIFGVLFDGGDNKEGIEHKE